MNKGTTRRIEGRKMPRIYKMMGGRKEEEQQEG
jgi:hypothetical protein